MLVIHIALIGIPATSAPHTTHDSLSFDMTHYPRQGKKGIKGAWEEVQWKRRCMRSFWPANDWHAPRVNFDLQRIDRYSRVTVLRAATHYLTQLLRLQSTECIDMNRTQTHMNSNAQAACLLSRVSSYVSMFQLMSHSSRTSPTLMDVYRFF